jgi:capsule polysaccharide export protein KpsE/RkpR
VNDQVNLDHRVAGARALRLRRARRLVMILAIFVAAPTLVTAVYYGLIATPQFESVATLTVGSGMPGSAGSKRGAERGDLQELQAAILSRPMFDKLTKQDHLFEHYKSAKVDWLSRMTMARQSDAGFDYYLGHVLIQSESESALTLTVLAFSAEHAHKLATAIVKRADQHLYWRAKRAHKRLVKDATKQVEEARASLTEVSQANPPNEIDLEVARARLAAALRTMEIAEGEALRQQRRLAVIAEPSLPSRASRPRTLWKVATVFFTALALGGMVLLMGDFVREHGKL